MKSLTFILCYSIFVSSCLNSNKIEKLLVANDKIVSANEFEMKSYESLPSWSKQYYSQKKYLELVDMHKRDYKKQSFKITYLSDGLKIKGIITVPRNFSPESVYPVVIYNRGGNRDFGAFNSTFWLIDDYSNRGYIVFASEYRGSGESEGKDEFGGRDVNDVINLISLSKKFKFTDKKNYFMVGSSRGGKMNYLVLKNGVKLNATVSIAAVSDQFLALEKRGEMERVFEELVPNYYQNRKQELKKRSAIFWGDKINSPLLLLHGDNDWRVSYQQSVNLAKVLKKKGKTIKLKIYPKGDHSLNKEWDDVVNEMLSWFKLFTVSSK